MEKRIVQDWFQVWEAEPGLFAIHEPFHSERVYSYLVLGRERALLVDTGTGVGDIHAVVEGITSLPVTVLNSHAHWDHVGGNWRFAEIWIHAAEATDLEHPRDNASLRRWFQPEQLTRPLPAGYSAETIAIPASKATRILHGGETVELGGRTLRIEHAPGHSAGGLVLVDEANGFMLSTDVVYAGRLYAYADDASVEQYRDTLDRLGVVARDLRAIYPSHNESPIEPGIVPRMRDAMEAIIGGRRPDAVEGGRATYAFDGFGVITKAPADRSGTMA